MWGKYFFIAFCITYIGFSPVYGSYKVFSTNLYRYFTTTFSINTKPTNEMKDCRIWICLECLFSVSVLWFLGSFMLGFWFEWPIIDFSTKQNLVEVAWVLPTFVYTLPFVLYLGSAKLAMASHFLVRHCTIV